MSEISPLVKGAGSFEPAQSPL